MNKVHPELLAALRKDGDFNATACMNCGTCTGLCPHGLDVLPRELFRYILLGIEDKVNDHIETIYSCLLCRMCEVNCPGGVNITGNIRAVRHYINRERFNV